MKVFLSLFSLFLISPVHSASFDIVDASSNNPYIGNIHECIESTCTGGVEDPWLIPDVNDTGEPQPDSEWFFWSGNDLVEREMSLGITYLLNETLQAKVSWTSFDIFQEGRMRLFGKFINLLETPSGSFEIMLTAGNLYGASVYMLANSLSSTGKWTVTFGQDDIGEPIPQVPLPASLFLLAPALLGFMRLRRQAKSS